MDKQLHGSKVAIIGAGQVGASIAYCAAIQQLCRELVLIDIDNAKAEGEAMDIAHGLPFLGVMNIYADDFSGVADADLIIITAGAARKPGETRLDLAAKNCRISKSITENVMKYYNGGAIMVVANPVDVLTYKIQEWSGLPRGRVFGSGTALDTIRFRYLLGKVLDIDDTNIHGYVLGEHGDSQFPLWSKIAIGGISLQEYLESMQIELNDETRLAIEQDTKNAGAEIIKRKGATHYGVAVSTCTIATSVLRNTDTMRPVGCVLDGEFGLKDVAMSVPAIINRDGIKSIIEYQLEGRDLERMHASAASLHKALDHVKNI
ncbi:MAG TPA: L-lactate dehydrogenase [Clostridiaceae bacterium]|nr:L-lactate dehydrogenase [Clostridiaceae bacterium]